METKGQFRVGVSFNPSASDLVSQIKNAAANFIDLIETIPSNRETEQGNEEGRLKALAQTEIESAAMWAMKAATKPQPKQSPMPSHVQRQIVEVRELRDRVAKLCAFIGSDDFMKLPQQEMDDLRQQLEQMAAYEETLSRRISRAQQEELKL